MENSTEFLDETKPLSPEALKKINSQAGDGTANTTGEVRDHNEGLHDDNKNFSEFESVDFTSYKSLTATSKYFSRVQDVANIVLNGYKVPFCSQDFRPITVPLSRNRVPVLPYCAYITSNGITGDGSTTFTNWMNTKEETKFDDMLISEENFEVLMDEKTKSKLMTLVAIWSNEYLDKGVRDSRARPSAVLGDWAYALPPTFSMTQRRIRTDVFAAWMYGAYTQTTPQEEMIIINNSDLRQFMNTNGGNYWPVEANTLCLALGKASTATVRKLKLLGHNVIIDFDNSMDSNRGTSYIHNGVQAWKVPATTVNACDTDIAGILNNTYSGVDIQWALLANTMPLSYAPADESIFHDNTFNLIVYENTIADQFINFFATHRDYGNKLPVTSASLPPFIQAWRVFKTVLTQRTTVELGVVGYLYEDKTYGKTLTTRNYNDMISCCFSVKEDASSKIAPLWIPYEMWICNGANLKLDDESYVDGESSVLVNEKYLVPRSQVVFDITKWSTATVVNETVNYYVPNNSVAQNTVSSIYFGTREGSCHPCTAPNWNSTSETQTIMWDKSQTIDFTYVSSGKNSNAVYRKKMVFESAVKN